MLETRSQLLSGSFELCMSLTSASAGVGGLTAEEATLASVPGLVELLQQLVDRCDELNDASANVEAAAAAAASMTAANLDKSGKKKGRRRRLARCVCEDKWLIRPSSLLENEEFMRCTFWTPLPGLRALSLST